MRRSLLPKTVILLLVAGAGCAAAPEPADEEADQPQEDTIVTLKPDGTMDVKTAPTTRAQVAREAQTRLLQGRAGAALTLAVNSACPLSSMWIYDQDNFRGRRLCLVRQSATFDWVNLNGLIRYTVGDTSFGFAYFWGGAVRSYMPGSDGGYFRTTDAVPAVQTFQPWTPVALANNTVSRSSYLLLDSGSMSDQTLLVFDYYLQECQVARFPVTFAVSDGQSLVSKVADRIQTVGPGPFGNVICRASIAWHLTEGVSHDISVGAPYWSGGCQRVRPLEGRLFTESRGTWADLRLSLNDCTTAQP